eukprot:gnl/MRDRNA2_/MRDRNA2_130064_c0_seq1.p1 gnl/MRDRNA2_/MRDRNA2_130064_c0~~gnl/MRDRNA2_/MRDRNA2_130064_c0_seq1.p1  ORF type:complete len:281 (+),score=36.41 gnl/MRDRNA2_/MRDRNA2_130064_c0_seq1:76-918(+)
MHRYVQLEATSTNHVLWHRRHAWTLCCCAFAIGMVVALAHGLLPMSATNTAPMVSNLASTNIMKSGVSNGRRQQFGIGPMLRSNAHAQQFSQGSLYRPQQINKESTMMNMQHYGNLAAPRLGPVVQAGTGTYTGFGRDLTGGMLGPCTADGEYCKWEGVLAWDGTNRQICVGTLPTDYPLSTTEAAGRQCIDAFTWATAVAGQERGTASNFQLICHATNEDLRTFYDSSKKPETNELMDAALRKIENLCNPLNAQQAEPQGDGPPIADFMRNVNLPPEAR